MAPLTPAAERLYEQLAPLAYADPENDFALQQLCQALARPFDQLFGLAHDAEVPWAVVMDLDTAYGWSLNWLAQFAGARLPGGLTDEQKRERIRRFDGPRRGSVAALKAAPEPYLTGTKTVVFRERVGGDAYALAVLTRLSETPDPDAVEAALLEQKPAGIVLEYLAVSGQTYDTARLTYDTYADGQAAYATYNDARLDQLDSP